MKNWPGALRSLDSENTKPESPMFLYLVNALQKRRPGKAFIEIYKEDYTSTKHVHTALDSFGYYECLEIREVIIKEK